MTNWTHVTCDQPCTICGKPDWCSRSADFAVSVCRRVGTTGGRQKVDRSGATFWIYGSVTPRLVTSKTPPAPVKPSTSLNDRDLIYRDLLSSLLLLPRDARALRARGLDSASLADHQYRSLPRLGRNPIVEKLIARFGRAAVLGVPGFAADYSARGEANVRLRGRDGLLIPVRDFTGKIVALKIRAALEVEDEGPRYTYLSSARDGGPTPGSPVHVPLHQERNVSLVRLTEGELKADVATRLTTVLTISVAGVTTWRQALPILKQLGAKTCRLAFDMDQYQNLFVARAVREAARQISEMGIAVELETWPHEFKGIDDALAAGFKPRVWCGPDAWKQIAAI